MSEDTHQVEISGISFTLDIDDEGIEKLQEMIMDQVFPPEKFVPKTIVDDAPEAFFIEFGSDPSKWNSQSKTNRQSKPASEKIFVPEAGRRMTPAEKRFYDWAKRKWPGDDAARIGHNVYRKVMEQGIPPQPFLRPALYRALMDPKSVDILIKDGTQGLADKIKDDAKAILEQNTADSSSPIVLGLRVTEVGEAGGISMNAMDEDILSRPPVSDEFDWPDRHGVYRARRYRR